jgi:hypothetical protein
MDESMAVTKVEVGLLSKLGNEEGSINVGPLISCSHIYRGIVRKNQRRSIERTGTHVETKNAIRAADGSGAASMREVHC